MPVDIDTERELQSFMQKLQGGSDDATGNLLREFLSRSVKQMKAQELSGKQLSEAGEYFGKAPDIALQGPAFGSPQKVYPTLMQRIYDISTNPVLSRSAKRRAVSGMLQEERIEGPEYNKLVAILGGAAGAAAGPKIMEMLSLGLLKHEPYRKGEKLAPGAGAAAVIAGSTEEERRPEGNFSKVFKDLIKYVGSAYIALTAARFLAQKSGFRDLRTPIEESNINVWNLMNR
jgi:hypothetical protein